MKNMTRYTTSHILVGLSHSYQAFVHAAEATTTTMSNVAALTSATMGSLIQHKVIVDDGAVTSHQDRVGFNLFAIVPSGLQVRNKVVAQEGSILVAPPNCNIPASQCIPSTWRGRRKVPTGVRSDCKHSQSVWSVVQYRAAA